MASVIIFQEDLKWLYQIQGLYTVCIQSLREVGQPDFHTEF